MKKYRIIILSGVFVLIFGFNLSFAQTETPSPSLATEAPEISESEVQWLWGEVSNVDAIARQISVKYLDYDTDTEKEIAITVDDKTTLENVKAIDEIKALDTVSIDYVVSPNGNNLAKNISVEKIELENPAPEKGTQEFPAPEQSQEQPAEAPQ